MAEWIIKTSEDAATAKASCAHMGYYNDPYVSVLCRKRTKKTPLINRGYWARINIVETVVVDFVKVHQGTKVQILNIGAGMETLFFRMHDSEVFCNVSKFVEMDFPEVISVKIKAMENKPVFHEITKDWKISSNECEGGAYVAFGGDLSKLDEVERVFKKHGVDFTAPTLIIAECVMNWMEVEDSDRLVKWYAENFTGNLAMFVYEQILPETRFGKMMVKNLQVRGLPTKSLFAYPTLEAQGNRYTGFGFQQAVARDLKMLYNEYIDQEECSRVARIELLDEFEEWNLLMEHYCCVLASKNAAANLGQTEVVGKLAWCDPERPKATGFQPPRNMLQRHSFRAAAGKVDLKD